MSNQILSIIIPVYQKCSELISTLQYLVKEANSFTEILVVDDGSSDGSSDELREYCSASCIITYYYKENGGVGSARNHGLKMAKGKYVAFLDSDDFLDFKALIRFVSRLDDEDADLGVFGYKEMFEGRLVSEYRYSNGGSFSKMDIDSDLYFGSSCWNKVVKRDFIIENGLLFKDRRIFEDLGVIPFWISRAQVAYASDECIYEYSLSEGSLTRSGLQNRLVIFDVIDNDLFDNSGLKDVDVIFSYVRRELYRYIFPALSASSNLNLKLFFGYMNLFFKCNFRIYKFSRDKGGLARFTEGCSFFERAYIYSCMFGAFFAPIIFFWLKRFFR